MELSLALSLALSSALSWDIIEPMLRKLQQPCLVKELREPKSSTQRYFLTDRGLEIWNALKK